MGLFTWLAGKFSRTQVVRPIDEISPPPLYLQHTRIGGGLTPADVSEILREVDSGYLYRFVDLFNESRQKDCQLQSVCGTRELAVSGMRWEVLAAGKTKKDQKVAAFTAEWMSNFGTAETRPGEEDPRDLRHLVSHHTGANLIGFSMAETLFEKDGGYVVPIGAVPLAHRRFIYDLEQGRLRFYDMFGSVPLPGLDLMADFPGRFTLYQPRVNGDVPYREGLARVLIWAALFRSWDIGDWMQLAEIAWKPWRIGKYKKASAKEDRAALLEAMRSLTSNGVAVLPETVEFVVEWAKAGGGSEKSMHGELAAFLGAEMSKAVLGATLTVEQGNVGSRALGEVHNEVRQDIRDADAAGIAAALRRTLIAPAVRLNFGRDVAIPGFAFHPVRQVDLVQLALAIETLVRANMPIPISWVRDIAGIPEPKKDEPILVSTKPDPPPGDQPLPTDGEMKQLRALLRDAEKRGLLPSNDAHPSAA